MRINSFFTTAVVDNGPVEALANRVLFAPLHYLLKEGSVHQVEVDLSQNRVKEIIQAPTPVRYLATKIGLYMLALGLVLPATALGAILKGFAQLHPSIAAKNHRASLWHPPTQREIFHEALVSAPRHRGFLDRIVNDVTTLNILPFLTAADLSRVSQVNKTWCRYANDDAVWMRISQSCSYFLPQKLTYRETFKINYLYIKQAYDPRVINIFGSIDKVLKLPCYQMKTRYYSFPNVRPDHLYLSYGAVGWHTFESDQKNAIVKGVLRDGSPFVLIRLTHEDSKKYYYIDSKEEITLKIFQDDYSKRWENVFTSLGPEFDRDEFLSNPIAHQWVKDLVEGKVCGSLVPVNRACNYPSYRNSGYENSTYWLANLPA